MPLREISVDHTNEAGDVRLLSGGQRPNHDAARQFDDAATRRLASYFDHQPWHAVKLFASIVAHVGFVVCLAMLVWVALNSDPAGHHYAVIPAVCLACCYVIVVLDAATSDVSAALKRLRTTQCADDYLAGVKRARPRVSWQVRCYHYAERRSTPLGCWLRAVTGRTRRVVSRHVSETLKFTSCTDMTLGHAELFRTPITMIESTKIFTIKDERGRENYMQQFIEFRESNQRHDDCMEHHEVLTIPAFLDHATFLKRGYARPWWLNKTLYWACSLLLLTWPYRWFFKRHSSRAYVVFVKELDVASKT